MPMTPRRARYADLGVHGISGVLVGHIVVAGLLLGVTNYSTSIEIDWGSAFGAFLIVGASLIVWLYLLFNPGRNQTEWLVAEAALVFSLMLTMSIVLLPAQYSAAALNRPLIDPLLARADGLLGVHVPDLVRWTAVQPYLVAWLRFAYDSLAVQFILAIPLLVVGRSRLALWEYAFHFHACALFTLAFFAAFPAACVFDYYGFVSLLPQDTFIEQFRLARSGQMKTLEFWSMEGLVSAPSFHVAGGLMITWAVRSNVWLLVPSLLLNGSLCAATVLTGTHYAIDLLMSAVMFAASVAIWRRICVRRFEVSPF